MNLSRCTENPHSAHTHSGARAQLAHGSALSPAAYRGAMRSHDLANLAKHDWSSTKNSGKWADAWSDAGDIGEARRQPQSCEEVASQPKSCAEAVDDVCLLSSPHRGLATPLLSDQVSPPVAEIGACHATSSADDAHFSQPWSCGAHDERNLVDSRNLIEAQNRTIMLLMSQLESWQRWYDALGWPSFDPSASGDVLWRFGVLEAQLAAFAFDLKELAS